eukprot:7967350-Lingulodinium_polyedra.AAC.1
MDDGLSDSQADDAGLTSKTPTPPPPPPAAAYALGASSTNLQQMMRVLHGQELARATRKAPETPY